MKLAEAVAELNPLDDLRQAVLAVELSPFPLRRHHELEGHCQSGPATEATFGALRAVPNGREGAFNWVRNRYADLGADVRLRFSDQGVCCEHPGQRHREHEGAGRPIRTLSCELELVAGRLCDSPATTGLGPVAPSVAAAESANP